MLYSDFMMDAVKITYDPLMPEMVLFLAAMSSSRSDIVTHAVRPSVCVLYFSIFALFFHAASYSLSRYTFLLAMSIETFHFALYESFLAALSSSRTDSVSNAVRTSVRPKPKLLFDFQDVFTWT